MRLVLHIGLSKTGSTSIQAGLSKNRALLAERGVLYPRLGPFANHNILSIQFRNTLPRTLASRSDLTRAGARLLARESWSQLARQVAKGRPETIVLSGEYLAELSHPDEFLGAVRRAIPNLSTIDVVAYLRRPSTHYLSLLQQGLKATSRIPRPRRVRFARKLVPFVGSAAVHLRELHPSGLMAGDVVRDFFMLALPEHAEHIQTSRVRRNETISAEGMALLQRFRRDAFPSHENSFNLATDRLLEAIRQVEARYQGGAFFTKPVLYPAIADFIDHATTDNAELDERFGFRFTDLGERRVRRLPREARRPTDVSDLITVDQAKLQILTSLALRHTLAPAHFFSSISSVLRGWKRI